MNIQYKAKSYSNVSASALVLLCASFAQAYAYETLETNPEVLMSSSAAAPLVQKVHVNYRKGRWASRSRGHSISMAAAQMQRRGK